MLVAIKIIELARFYGKGLSKYNFKHKLINNI